MTPEKAVDLLLVAKRKEEAAKAERIAAEANLIELIYKGAQPEEGSKTHMIGEHKVTIKGVVNRRLDYTAWLEIEDTIPLNMRPVVLKPSLDEKGVKWLRDNAADIYKVVAKCITSKPGKVGVTIK